MAIQQATAYRATAKLLDGDTTELNNTMPSNQTYVTRAANGTVSLDTPLIDVLRGANPRALDTAVWGVARGDNSYFLADNNSIKGGMTDGYGAMTSEYGYNDFKLVDKDGNDKPLILDVQTKSGTTDNFTIYFDRGWGIYATRIEVDGKVYFDNNFIFTYKGDVQKSQFNVKITHVSKAGYPLVVLAILSGLSITFDRWNGLNNFGISNRNSFDTRTIAEWGIVTQQGSMEISDINGEIQQLQEMGILQNEQTMIVKMSYIDRFSGVEEWKTIGDYYSRFNYTFGAKEVPIEMHGSVEDWQNIPYGGKDIVFNMRAWYLLLDLMKLSNKNWSISLRAEHILYNTNIKYAYLNSSTLYEAINKVLYINMCVLWESEDGKNIYVDLYDGNRYVKETSPVYRLNKTRTYGNLQGRYNDVVKGVKVDNNNVLIRENQQIFSISEIYKIKDESGVVIKINPNNYEIITVQFQPTAYNTYDYYIKIPIIFDSNVISYSSGKSTFVEGVETTITDIIKLENELKNDDIINRRTTYIYISEKIAYLYIFVGYVGRETGSAPRITIDSFSISLSGTIYEIETVTNQYGNVENATLLNSNELMQVDTTYPYISETSIGKPISQHIAETLIATETGKQTLEEVTIQKNDYYAYSRNGGRTGQNIIASYGETLKVGNFVEIWDDRTNLPFIRDKTGDTKVFEVRGVSKARSGDPLKLTLQLKEV